MERRGKGVKGGAGGSGGKGQPGPFWPITHLEDFIDLEKREN